jgi:hypothetical protein
MAHGGRACARARWPWPRVLEMELLFLHVDAGLLSAIWSCSYFIFTCYMHMHTHMIFLMDRDSFIYNYKVKV